MEKEETEKETGGTTMANDPKHIEVRDRRSRGEAGPALCVAVLERGGLGTNAAERRTTEQGNIRRKEKEENKRKHEETQPPT